MTYQVSHPHKRAGKIIFLYILFFIFVNKLEEKDATPNVRKKVRFALNFLMNVILTG